MKIKSIELKNFRIFAGANRIDFSMDREDNVTIIMGDNGSGKTTLAQAFTWCLYGKTTFKDGDDLLSIPVKDKLKVGQNENVEVEIALESNNREYTIRRTKEYRKDGETNFHAQAALLDVSYRTENGETEFVERELQKQEIINMLVPESISPYFFFDGEKVEKMGNEIQDGRSSKEFKIAVENILGLSALSEALRHLKSGAISVIPSYSREYNANSDTEFQQAERMIQATEARIERLKKELEELQEKRAENAQLKEEYRRDLERARESKQLAERRAKVEREIERSESEVKRERDSLLKEFSDSSWRFFARPLLTKAVHAVKDSDIEIKDAPANVNADTIKDILERKECICGNKIEFNSSEWKHLQNWLEIVPPEHMGAALKNFEKDCSLLLGDANSSLLNDVSERLRAIENYEIDISEYEEEKARLTEDIEKIGAKASTERLYQAAKNAVQDAEERIEQTSRAIGQAEATLRDAKAKQKSLTTDDETNRRVRRDKAYAERIYESLKRVHDEREKETREKLEDEINAIFKQFFSESLTLSLDSKYKINVRNMDDNYSYDIETSEGQTVSVIFAFIAGVIHLASSGSNVDESYPLVMDAPMSKLDKKRIKAVCEVLPKIAEQAVILIKDTDGDLARKYLQDRIGVEYSIVSIEPERQSCFERRA